MRERRAWASERERLRRERRSYWLGIGEVCFALVVLTNLALGLAVLVVGHA